MAKLTDARVATLKSFFNVGDQPSESNFADLIQYIQEGIEEHSHDGAGDGDGISDLVGLTSLGIGTDSPGDHGAGELVVVVADNGGITIKCDPTHTACLHFADGTVGGAQYRGYIRYDQNNDKMWFGTSANFAIVLDATGRLGNVVSPLAELHFDQSVDDAAIPVLILDQADISEGLINFIASDRGVIGEGTNSAVSVRVELGGVVYRLALYADG